jgi:hypothetical protein
LEAAKTNCCLGQYKRIRDLHSSAGTKNLAGMNFSRRRVFSTEGLTMKSPRIRLILGLIAATVLAADEQVLHLCGMNNADNQSLGARIEKAGRGSAPALVATISTGSLPHGLAPPTRPRTCQSLSRTRTPCSIPMTFAKGAHLASQAPQGIVDLPVQRVASRVEQRGSVHVVSSPHRGKRRREEGDDGGLMDLSEVQVSGLA